MSALATAVKSADYEDRLACSATEALVGCLSDIEGVAKNRRVDAGPLHYAYSNIDDVLDVVKVALNDWGFALLQPITGSPDGTVVFVETVLVHHSGERFSSGLLPMRAGGNAQAAGSAMTYGRRYSLQAFLGIATDDDDGAAASRQVQSAPPRQEPPPIAAPRTHEEASIREWMTSMSQGDAQREGRLFQDRFGCRLRDLDVGQHREAYEWMLDQQAMMAEVAAGIERPG